MPASALLFFLLLLHLCTHSSLPAVRAAVASLPDSPVPDEEPPAVLACSTQPVDEKEPAGFFRSFGATRRLRKPLVARAAFSESAVLERWADDATLKGLLAAARRRIGALVAIGNTTADESGQHHAVFVYRSRGMPLTGALQARYWARGPGAKAEEVLMSAAEFFARRDRGELLYFSGNPTDFPQLHRDVRSIFQALRMDPNSIDAVPAGEATLRYAASLGEASEAIDDDREHVSPVDMLWMGTSGVVAQTHYDLSHNLFVQIRGRKRFILLPPREASRLYLYPSLHPSRRQSQLDFGFVNRTRFPLVPPCFPTVEVVLEPGDMLYLPPLWFHRVIAESFSVSVSTWSDSEEFNMYQAAQRLPLPFESSWTVPQWRRGLQLFVQAFADRLKPSPRGSPPFDMLATLASSRYLFLMDSVSAEDVGCNFDSQSDILATTAEKIVKRASDIAATFVDMQLLFPDGIDGEESAMTMALNYIEDVIGSSNPLGSPLFSAERLIRCAVIDR